MGTGRQFSSVYGTAKAGPFQNPDLFENLEFVVIVDQSGDGFRGNA